MKWTGYVCCLAMVVTAFMTQPVIGQETYGKIYSNRYVGNSSPLPDLDVWEHGWWRFSNLSLAFGLKEEHAAHELELTRLQVKTDTEDGVQRESQVFSLRYEYIIPLDIFSDWEKGQFYLGASIKPYYGRVESDPISITEYPYTDREIGVGLGVVPRFEYPFHERWYLDINFAMDLLNWGHFYYKREHPMIPSARLENSGLELDLGVINANLRIGFAYLFSVSKEGGNQ